MATIELWIQLADPPGDVSPNNMDRITGLTVKETDQNMGLAAFDPVDVMLSSPENGVTRTRRMFKTLRNDNDVIDTLILGSYQPNLTAPDSCKINRQDSVVVRFRNKDFRTGLPRWGTTADRRLLAKPPDPVHYHFRIRAALRRPDGPTHT